MLTHSATCWPFCFVHQTKLLFFFPIDPNNPRENIEICVLEGNYFAFYTEKTKYSLEDLNVTRTTTGSTTTTTTTYTTSTTTEDPIRATL